MVHLAVTRERRPGETRAALIPDVVRKLIAGGSSVTIETGAGRGASAPDDAFEAAGASIAPDAASAVAEADIVLTVRAPGEAVTSALRRGALVVGLLDPHRESAALEALARAGASAFAMEFVPRISRAQGMDALSSQANLAGYRAVIEASAAYGRALPMMMTAAGTVAPAKVFVMGAGVAGLQAIATARRLGAVVTATDVRPAAKEQVESLGAKFVAVEDEEFTAAETAAGYAREMSADYQARQASLISDHIRKQDIVITTALIPGRPAPRLVTAAQAASMRPGSIIIDLAVEQGGNVEGARDREAVASGGATIVGFANLPARIAADASALYARNLAAFTSLLVDAQGQLVGEFDDEILAAALVVHEGKVIHPALQAT
ncbi:MAG TPA: Re/Si-specific NAD(P)(+) transhydrogenase subunit alpha [Caulobacteraceae bacterium]|nr:Re/Si-specific NAD(P)(+) transhydrogenase subunit alpha [Caulobacteraceae bacterium]